jgi:uncharacterized protein YdhG (YjbR/CyaY superfamily)
MSYGMPAFIQGKPIAGYAASANHCAYYPMSGSVVATLKRDLEAYETSRGAIRFPIGKPLPATLIRKLGKRELRKSPERLGRTGPRRRRRQQRRQRRRNHPA